MGELFSAFLFVLVKINVGGDFLNESQQVNGNYITEKNILIGLLLVEL